MSKVKSGGTAKNLTDSNPQFLGVKRYAGEKVNTGNVIVRQRGTKIMAGANIGIGKDHTLFALKDGVVSYTEKRKTNYDGSTTRRKVAHVN